MTRPAVPPYSSTTTATCVDSRCSSCSRAATDLDSGTKRTSRMAAVTGPDCAAPSWCSARVTSLRCSMPRMSSASSPITGMRELPERRNRAMAWPRVWSASMVTTSVRGTITERTMVSFMENTDWMSSASESASTSASWARATTSRRWRSWKSSSSSSSSSRRRRSRPRRSASGPRARRRPHTSPPRRRATAASLREPNGRGLHTPSSAATPTRTAAAMSTANQVLSTTASAAAVRHTADSASATNRHTRRAPRWLSRSAVTSRTREPGRRRTMSSASRRER